MGVGAAFVMPVTLSVITTIFPPEERGKAVGTWVGVAAGGGVIGLLVSGVLLEWLSWPAIFGLNVVLAAIALAGTIAIVPAHPRGAAAAARSDRDADLGRRARGARLRDHRRRRARLERRSACSRHSSPASAGSCCSSSGSCAGASRCSTRATSCRRGFGAGSLSVTVQFFAAFGFLFLALPYLQLVMGFSPLQASAALLPMALVVIPLSRVAPTIAGRVGVRVTGAAGLSLMAIGFLVLSRLDVGLVVLGLPGRTAPVRRRHGARPALRRRPRSSPRSRARSRASRRR